MASTEPTDLRPSASASPTFAKMKSLELDAVAHRKDNDATAFFAATGDLLVTGPTLTNVNHIRVILVE